MGVRSLPIVLATALFTGFIMTIQAAVVIGRYDAEGLLGWAVGFVTLREVGPILIALMFSGRVGANNTAELGTMTVTEQIDGLRALAIDPLSYLILPRALAMIALLFILTVYGDLFALVGAAFMGEAMLDVPRQTFARGLIEMLGPWDLATGLVKSVVYAMSPRELPVRPSVKGGAPGVGRAVNASVVASASGVFVLDYFVTYLLR
jgi:phospholipid/cholesterol/gamma-HCH transport system permease protein